MHLLSYKLGILTLFLQVTLTSGVRDAIHPSMRSFQLHKRHSAHTDKLFSFVCIFCLVTLARAHRVRQTEWDTFCDFSSSSFLSVKVDIDEKSKLVN